MQHFSEGSKKQNNNITVCITMQLIYTGPCFPFPTYIKQFEHKCVVPFSIKSFSTVKKCYVYSLFETQRRGHKTKTFLEIFVEAG